MNKKILLWVSLALLAASPAFAADVIIRTTKPYTAVKSKIAALGGTVTYEFRHANGLAATVPDSKVDSLKAIKGVQYYVKDLTIAAPQAREVVEVSSEIEGLGDATPIPGNFYSYNSELTNVFPLQNAGFLGQNVVVGMIDTGTSRFATTLCADATTSATCAATSRVIGGQSFVAGEPDATGPPLGDHGTWTAGMVGANRGFLFSHTGRTATALRNYCNPVSTFPCAAPFSATADAVFVVGQAPAAQFYAFKVFRAAGGGASTSTIMQAMDAAIDVKNTTQPNMKVVNMSLGGPTLFAGGDIEDELATAMADAGISLVVSSGNAGPAGSTVGSPGTAAGIVTVGATSDPVHERVLRDAQFGTGIGALYRPDNNQQMAYFSSRGPDANGRINPDIVASGFASFAQGAGGGLFFVSGTSFAAPTVAGIMADLYSKYPSATPDQVRSALLAGANPAKVPTAGLVDQGFGHVDAQAASLALAGGAAGATDPAPGSQSVRQNVSVLAGITPIDSSSYSTALGMLRPAERRDFYYAVKKGTKSVKVSLTGITPENPPAGQNAFFGDDMILSVHSAKTSAIGEGDYLVPLEFDNANTTHTLTNLDTGLIRVTVMGDWTNVGRVAANLSISEMTAPLPRHTFKGKIVEGQQKIFTATLPAGLSSVTFSTSWAGDWSSYPTNDLDMFVIPPSGPPNFAGATINSPERATIANPGAGTWTIVIDGFTVFPSGGTDNFEVRVDY